MVAAAIIGTGVLSAGTSLYGSSKTSSAATNAANAQLSMYNTTRSDLSPYNTTGQAANQSALSLAQSGSTGGGPDYVSQAAANMPGTMTQSQLEQTPGYQWNLAQGLKATQSAAAARGLGVSGASLKGASTYATGLADSTYKDQFNNAQSRFSDYLQLNTGQQTNLSNQFSRLNALSTTGEQAAAQTGQQGTYAASNYGNYTTQSAADTAAGLSGVSNAASSGVNSYLTNQALTNALNNSNINANTLANATTSGNQYGTTTISSSGYGSR